MLFRLQLQNREGHTSNLRSLHHISSTSTLPRHRDKDRDRVCTDTQTLLLLMHHSWRAQCHHRVGAHLHHQGAASSYHQQLQLLLLQALGAQL